MLHSKGVWNTTKTKNHGFGTFQNDFDLLSWTRPGLPDDHLAQHLGSVLWCGGHGKIAGSAADWKERQRTKEPSRQNKFVAQWCWWWAWWLKMMRMMMLSVAMLVTILSCLVTFPKWNPLLNWGSSSARTARSWRRNHLLQLLWPPRQRFCHWAKIWNTDCWTNTLYFLQVVVQNVQLFSMLPFCSWYGTVTATITLLHWWLRDPYPLPKRASELGILSCIIPTFDHLWTFDPWALSCTFTIACSGDGPRRFSFVVVASLGRTTARKGLLSRGLALPCLQG